MPPTEYEDNVNVQDSEQEENDTSETEEEDTFLNPATGDYEPIQDSDDDEDDDDTSEAEEEDTFLNPATGDYELIQDDDDDDDDDNDDNSKPDTFLNPATGDYEPIQDGTEEPSVTLVDDPGKNDSPFEEDSYFPNNQITGTRLDDNLTGSKGFLRRSPKKDEINGKDGNDTLKGGEEDDLLLGGNDNDRLYGEQDNDYLYGGAGSDTLEGGEGNDYVDGEGELSSDTYDDKDSLTGGRGADVFDLNGYRYAGNEDYAIVADYSSEEGDVLNLDGTAEDYYYQVYDAKVGSTEDDVAVYYKNGTSDDGDDELVGIVLNEDHRSIDFFYDSTPPPGL